MLISFFIIFAICDFDIVSLLQKFSKWEATKFGVLLVQIKKVDLVS